MSELSRLLEEMREDDVLAGVRAAKSAGTPVGEIIEQLQEGMRSIGDKYQAGEYFLSELIMSAEVLKRALLELGIDDSVAGPDAGPTFVLGTAQHDIHDIGKDVVASVLRANGFRVVDLGVDVPPQRFVSAVQEHQARLVGVSCLLTTAFDSLRDTVGAFQASGLRNTVSIFVGGWPVTGQLAEQIGADGAGLTAQDAVLLAKHALETAP